LLKEEAVGIEGRKNGDNLRDKPILLNERGIAVFEIEVPKMGVVLSLLAFCGSKSAVKRQECDLLLWKICVLAVGKDQCFATLTRFCQPDERPAG
jgi:hypothetical protein